MSPSTPNEKPPFEAPAERPGRRLLLDLGPLLLFFGTNYLTKDFMLAIKVLIAATLVALLIGWLTERRISVMAAVGCVAVALFGGLSVYFDNEIFIKVKPTILTVLLAVLIAGGRMIGRNPIRAIMGAQLQLTETGWRQMSWLWVLMFLTTALANEIAWRMLSTDDWVTFKAFGLTGISLVFMVASLPILTKQQIEK
ncbi:septation protein IspZ [Alphaproteobacteria bacterium]|jgi:intracellular septation protein|nr:septation protein IspZ [Alphaproteobacteria bacterium]